MTLDEKINRMCALWAERQYHSEEFAKLANDPEVFKRLMRMTDEEIRERTPKNERNT